MFGKLLNKGVAALDKQQHGAAPAKAEGKTDTKSALNSLLQSGQVKNILAGLSPQQQKEAIDDAHSQLETGVDLPTSSCTGTKKSLFIGINYIGTKNELRGCFEDVKNIKAFVVEKFHFPTDDAHMMTLMDDSKDASKVPTRANMLKALEWLVAGAKDGDSLFFHYSGHGGQVKDEDGDELDGFDECLIPCDYQQAGMIVDDIIHEQFVKNLPKGVRLTAIMDCCHSGSMFDLPFTYNIDGTIGSQKVAEVDNRKAAIEAAVQAGHLLFAGDKKAAMAQGMAAAKLFVSSPAPGKTNEAGQKVMQIKTTLADVIQFSGCKDEQTSADATIGGKPSGAMSWAFIEAFKSKGMDLDYITLLAEVRNLLKGKYQQIPEMSCGRKLNLKTKFIM